MFTFVLFLMSLIQTFLIVNTYYKTLKYRLKTLILVYQIQAYFV